ncbi:hypothetical protein BJQ90_02582 [Arthrobacter sp. SO3]|nr:hypothetical protein [Arthrobacter sp. SO3]
MSRRALGVRNFSPCDTDSVARGTKALTRRVFGRAGYLAGHQAGSASPGPKGGAGRGGYSGAQGIWRVTRPGAHRRVSGAALGAAGIGRGAGCGGYRARHWARRVSGAALGALRSARPSADAPAACSHRSGAPPIRAALVRNRSGNAGGPYSAASTPATAAPTAARIRACSSRSPCRSVRTSMMLRPCHGSASAAASSAVVLTERCATP